MHVIEMSVHVQLSVAVSLFHLICLGVVVQTFEKIPLISKDVLK